MPWRTPRKPRKCGPGDPTISPLSQVPPGAGSHLARPGQGPDCPDLACKLAQAAWGQLIQLTDAYRQDHAGRLDQRPFHHVVITYPTIASPAVRTEIRKLVREMGFHLVQTDYDEAVSAALFYLWCEFGDSTGIGLEAFKARCRPVGDKWVQKSWYSTSGVVPRTSP